MDNAHAKKLSINHIVNRYPKYSEARTIFNIATPIRLALSKENTEEIYKLFLNIHLNYKT